MTTDAARRAADALNKRREAEGLKRVTVWLSAEARFKLDALKAVAGSKDRAADAAIRAWPGPQSVSFVVERQVAGSELTVISVAGKLPDTTRAKVTVSGRPKVPYGSLLKKPKGKAS